MKLLKKDLVDKIYERTNGEVNKLVIHDVITITVDYIIEELKGNRSFSVRNFGTFSPYRFKDRLGMNISSRVLKVVKGFNGVKFRAHSSFNLLLKKKKQRFKKKIKK